MSKFSSTIPVRARSDRSAVPNLPAWKIADLQRAEAGYSAGQSLQLELPASRPWADDLVDGESDGMLTMDL